ncbi:MAG: response regulator transcription factor [Ignavibacteria bacterium]
MKKIRLLVIEDNRLLRDGIVAMINEQEDLRIVAALENQEKVHPKITETKPDIVLIDLGLQGKNSLQLVRNIKLDFPEVKIIVMDLLPLQQDIYEFIKTGASGFILKEADVDDFLNTIRLVNKGQKILPTNLTGSLFSQIVTHAAKISKESGLIRAVRLTKRERQVIELISDGLTNKEIGWKLHLSPFTIKSHVHNILEKLAIHNRIEIAKYAHEDQGFNDMKDLVSLIDESSN